MRLSKTSMVCEYSDLVCYKYAVAAHIIRCYTLQIHGVIAVSTLLILITLNFVRVMQVNGPWQLHVKPTPRVLLSTN